MGSATDKLLAAAPASLPGKTGSASVSSLMDFSRPWKNGGMFAEVGPVPLGLLAFSSEVHATDKMKLTPNVRFLLLVFLPVAAIGLMCILFVLLSDQNKSKYYNRSSEKFRLGQA